MAKGNKEDQHATTGDSTGSTTNQSTDSTGSPLLTTAIAGAAIAVLAPELLPGMAVGVVAVMAPKILPVVGNIMNPIFKTAVRAGYGAAVKAREMASEAGEQIQDIVAEAKAEAAADGHHTTS
jgi:hypothetical protein